MKKFNVEFQLTDEQIDFIKNLKLEENGSFKYFVQDYGMYVPLLHQDIVMEDDNSFHGHRQFLSYAGYEIKKQLELEQSEKDETED